MNTDREVKEAAEIIKQGGVVAFPTETYYGLAADPFNSEAVKKLFRLKNRPEQKPVLLLISDLEQLEPLVKEIPPVFQPLFVLWPAPLTLVFKARSTLSSSLTAGTGTVGVRISPHPSASALVKQVGRPITATSANPSGRPPAIKAEAVKEYFGRRLDYLLKGGTTTGGAPSTLVGYEGDELVLLREGALSFDRLKAYVHPS
ncbi:MAG: L-threonylcarbamoyladenylate synthase [Desulfurivibrionaceae bacterium]